MRRPAAMPNKMRSLLALMTLIALTAACSPGTSIPIPGATGPLLTVETRGGECLDGPCGSTVVIERDGTVHSADKPPNALGALSAEQLAALDAAVKTADFDAIRAVAFTGECPVNFDGQEWIYEFGAPGGVERVASCETEIDPANPVFAAVSAALTAVDVLPAP